MKSSAVHFERVLMQPCAALPASVCLLCVMGIATCLLGCSRKKEVVSIFVAGDTHGWITPCGCAANQSGGLARRASILDHAKSSGDVLLLDAGGSALGTSEYQRLRLEYLLRGLKAMGLAAHNIGKSETDFSPDALKSIGQQQNVTWLSANAYDSSGQPVGQLKLILPAGGLKIAITGVIDPDLIENADWQAGEPVQAVLKAFANVTADVRIVLAYMDEGRLRTLAQSLPEVDYVIGGPTGQSVTPTRIGPVTMMSATNKGKFLAHLQLAQGSQSNSTRQRSNSAKITELLAEIAEVRSTLPERKDQLDNLHNYYQHLGRIDFTALDSGLVQPLSNNEPGYAIAGSQSCQTCHQSDDAVWHNTKHSHAWEVLVAKEANYDPHCQQCHSTGYGLPGGFVNVAQSKPLVHVGCENCHGPSQAHVENPRKKTPYQAKQQCIGCHDHENSPQFDLEPYWTKVFHRGKKANGNQ